MAIGIAAIISTTCIVILTAVVALKLAHEIGSWAKRKIKESKDKRYFEILINKSSGHKMFPATIHFLINQDLSKCKKTTNIVMNISDKLKNVIPKNVLIPTVGEEFVHKSEDYGNNIIRTIGDNLGNVTGFLIRNKNRDKLQNFVVHVGTNLS